MGPYYTFILFLVVVPFFLGLLYSVLLSFDIIIAITLILIAAFLFILKISLDKRRATLNLWRSRLKNLAKHNGEIDLSVVIPAYNEELRLPNMLDEALEFLEARRKDTSKLPETNIYRHDKFTYEIIIVDDGSKDKTTACGLRYQKRFGSNRIKVITLTRNLGKGGAVRVGVLASKGSYVIFADADGASKFSEIEKLEEFIYENNRSHLVIAIGSRAHMEQEAIATRSLFRTILMKGFHLLVWTCCVRTVRDTQCGFKMFNRFAAQILFTNYHNESWAFDVELLYLAEQTNCTIGEIAINWTEVEGSKIVPVFSWIRMGWDVLCLTTLYTLGIYTVPYKQELV